MTLLTLMWIFFVLNLLCMIIVIKNKIAMKYATVNIIYIVLFVILIIEQIIQN